MGTSETFDFKIKMYYFENLLFLILVSQQETVIVISSDNTFLD